MLISYMKGVVAMITEFGKALRKLRIERNEYLKNMAEKLDISVAYLSAMENGKRKVPEDLVLKIANIYQLSPRETNKLLELRASSSAELKISLDGKSDQQRKTLLSFAKALDDMSNDDLDQILHIIIKKRN